MCYCWLAFAWVFPVNADDLIDFSHAVNLGVLPMVERRLDPEERVNIQPGNVYIWEERGSPIDIPGIGIERW